MVNKMNKLYYLKKYYRELMQSINRYNDLIDTELKSLDMRIMVNGNDGFKTIDLINHRIQRDSVIDSMIDIIGDYYRIRKAKIEKAEVIAKRINEYELYMKQRGMI